MTEGLHLHFSLSCIGEGSGKPLQCSCLENPRDEGAGRLQSMGSKELDTTATTPPQSIQVNLECPNNCFNSVFISGCGESLLLLTGFLWLQ